MWVRSSNADMLNGVLKFENTAAHAGYQYCMTGPVKSQSPVWVFSKLGPLKRKCKSMLPTSSIGEPLVALNGFAKFQSMGSMARQDKWFQVLSKINLSAVKSGPIYNC